MARFDIYKYNNPGIPFVLDVQADLLSGLNTCVVIPLVSEQKAKREAVPKLKPIIKVGSKDYVLMTTDIGTLTRSSLGEKVSNVENEHRQTVTEALDFLFQGF